MDRAPGRQPAGGAHGGDLPHPLDDRGDDRGHPARVRLAGHTPSGRGAPRRRHAGGDRPAGELRRDQTASCGRARPPEGTAPDEPQGPPPSRPEVAAARARRPRRGPGGGARRAIAVAIVGILSTSSDYRDGGEQARSRAADRQRPPHRPAERPEREPRLHPAAQRRQPERVPGRPRPLPGRMAELRERLRGQPELEASAEAVDRTAQLWFSEAGRAHPAAAPGARGGGDPAHQPGPQRGPLQRVPRRARPAPRADRARARRTPWRPTTAAACSPSSPSASRPS